MHLLDRIETQLMSNRLPLVAISVAAVPYANTPALNHYPPADRCNVINGASCALGQSQLDTIGVQITYNYTWHTPLKSLLGFTGGGWTVVKSNAMEMEPVL